MSLTDVSTIASIVSSIAVAASLVYLALQTHQNAKQTRALVWNAIEDRNVNMPLAMTDENLCRAFIIENGGEATPEAVRQRQCNLMYAAMFSSYIDFWRQGEMGIVERPTEFSRSRYVERLRREPSHRQFIKAVVASENPGRPYLKSMFAYLRGVVEEAELPA